MKKNIFLILPLMLIVLAVVYFSNQAEGGSKQAAHREVISTPAAPPAIGPYSQAIRVGNTLYLSGQLGLDPKTRKFVGGGFEGQARQALKNHEAVLKAARFKLTDVVQCQVFVKDMNNYPLFNKIYQEFFKKDFPARAVLEVSRIPADGLIEIMMTAVKE
jgi:2-iminobutanoate/2-iminopropanoate deaminase